MKTLKNIEVKNKKFIDEGFGQWIVTIKDKNWQELLKTAKKAVMEQVEVSGFRKGKVPENIAQQHISEAEILKNAANKAIKLAYQYGLDHQEAYEIKATGQPKIEIEDASNEQCKLSFSFDLPLHVELKKYQNLNINKPTVKVSKNEIEQQIALLKDRFAVYSEKEKGTLQQGEIAVISFKGTVKGKAFPGGSSENFELEIGSKKFIPGFEEQMIGMKIDEHRVITVKFPKDYQVKNLAGEDAEFAVHLKEIKIKKISGGNDDLVKDVNIPNVKTYDDLVNHIKAELTKQKTNSIHQEVIDEIFTNILKSAKIVIPKTVIDNETNRLMNEFKQELSQKNVTLDQYKEMTGFNDDVIRTEAKKDALWQLQTFIIIEEVIKAEKIDTTEVEVEEYLQAIANQFNMPIEQIKNTIKDLTSVTMTLKRKKAIDWLYENNCQSQASAVKKTDSK